MANNYVNVAMEETPRYQGAVATTPYRVSTSSVYLPTTAAHINAVPSFIDRTNELRNILGVVPMVVETFAPEGSIAERAYINHMVYLLTLAGFKGTAVAGDGITNVWSIVWAGTAATGGTFTITVGGQTTAPIAYNATDAVIQAALEALSTVGVGNVLVATTAGGPLPTNGTKTLTFRGALFALTQVVTVSAAGLTGGAPTVTPTSTTAAVVPTIQNPDWTTGDTYALQPGRFVTTGATKWTFTKRVGAQAQTAQIIAAYGDMGMWLQGQGFGVTSLAMDAAGALTASLLGLYVAPVSDPALTPTLDSQSIIPAKRGDLTLTWLAGGGVVDDFSFSIANPLQVVRSLSLPTPSLFPDIMENGDSPVLLTGTIPKRRIASADFVALWAGTTFAAKARWMTPNYVGQSGSKYAMWIVMPSCQYVGGTPDDLYNRRRFGASFNFQAQYDETAGYDVQIVLVCGVSAAQLSAPFTV